MLRSSTRTLLRSPPLARLQQRSYQVDRSTWIERNMGPLLIVGAVLSLASIMALQPRESWLTLGPTPTVPPAGSAPTVPPAGSAEDVMGSQGKITPPPAGRK